MQMQETRPRTFFIWKENRGKVEAKKAFQSLNLMQIRSVILTIKTEYMHIRSCKRTMKALTYRSKFKKLYLEFIIEIIIKLVMQSTDAKSTIRN